jgi:uncharacterized iron-regulated protein
VGGLSRAAIVVLSALFLSGCGFIAGGASGGVPSACVAAGQWVAPRSGGVAAQAASQVLAEFAKRQVVLLGEAHEDPEHHRWQLHMIAGLLALRPRMVLGFEMFPRRLQPVLDDWVAGRLGDTEFLTRAEWQQVWGYDPHLYLPIFHFARMHRIPMLALNVERQLVTRVGDEGWASIPAGEREGITDPAPADRDYAVRLYQSYLDHQLHGGYRSAQRKPPSEDDLTEPKFRRFVEAMQVWDRAMAQGIAEKLRGDDPPLVVAILGSGHVRNGDGVPRQLRDLGVTRIAVALPWNLSDSCAELVPGVADVVFGVEARPQPARPDRPRLGISIDPAPTGVLVRSVVPGSIAEQAGLRAGDVIVRIAGESAVQTGDVVDAVQRQAPGTWLPITVKRGEEHVEIVARFPPQK